MPQTSASQFPPSPFPIAVPHHHRRSPSQSLLPPLPSCPPPPSPPPPQLAPPSPPAPLPATPPLSPPSPPALAPALASELYLQIYHLYRHQQHTPYSRFHERNLSHGSRFGIVLPSSPSRHPAEPSPRSLARLSSLAWLGVRRGSALQLARLLARLSRAAWLGSAWQPARLSARLSMAAGSAIGVAQHSSRLGYRRGLA